MNQRLHTQAGTIHRQVTEKLDPVRLRNLHHGYITVSHRRIKTTTFQVGVTMSIDLDKLFERCAHRAAEAKNGTAKYVDGFITAIVDSHTPLEIYEREVQTLDQQFPDQFEQVDDDAN